MCGEIRWRRPQDFFELLPRPACGDCGLFEAFSECADCGEYFCSVCYQKVGRLVQSPLYGCELQLGMDSMASYYNGLDGEASQLFNDVRIYQ